MVRYLGIVAGEGRRMHVARQSRGYDPRWLWQARGIAASAGTLFVRSYERGERVYLAMLSRGYDGTMPALEGRRTSACDWWPVAFPLVAWTLAAAALVAG
jgi:cobalt/nickel transport system permease protein